MVGLITLGEESAQKILASTPTYWCQSCDDITAFRLDSHKPHLPEKIEEVIENAINSKEYDSLLEIATS